MIREFKHSDLEIVMTIWLDSNISAHDFINEEYFMGNYNRIKEILPEATLFVFEENEEIDGFIGMEDNFIAGIFVRREKQSKGIGKVLLDAAKQTHQSLFLKVFEKNKRAVQFYKREDFDITEKVMDEQTGESEYVMSWHE